MYTKRDEKVFNQSIYVTFFQSLPFDQISVADASGRVLPHTRPGVLRGPASRSVDLLLETSRLWFRSGITPLLYSPLPAI
jgi:hypothetical protein